MNEITYMVIEGTHKNPNDKSTIIKKTKKKFMVLLIKKG